MGRWNDRNDEKMDDKKGNKMTIEIGDLVLRKETMSMLFKGKHAGIVMDILPMGVFGEKLYEILWSDGSFQKLTSKGIERVIQ